MFYLPLYRVCVPLLLLVKVGALGCLFPVSESISSLAFLALFYFSLTPLLT